MKRIAGAAMLLLLGACVPTAQAPRGPIVRTAPLPPPPPVVPPPSYAVEQAPASLAQAIAVLARGFDGVVGIAVRDVRNGWVVSSRGTALYPQQSVSKLWVAITVLDAVDAGQIRLDQSVTIRREDLTLFHQPIRALVGADGFTTTIADLLERALTRSDNTANDKLLWTVGGPDAVRAMLVRKGLGGIRFGPGERLLQSGTAGIVWHQAYSIGNGFEAARDALPFAAREAALRRYLADPIDGASPEGITAALARLRGGTLLSPQSTQYLIGTMGESKTGPLRMRAGVPPGWGFAHKTGTGQELGGFATGYNDVGLVTAPDGRSFAVAVMIGSTRRPIPDRMALMQSVTRAVGAFAAGG